MSRLEVALEVIEDEVNALGNLFSHHQEVNEACTNYGKLKQLDDAIASLRKLSNATRDRIAREALPALFKEAKTSSITVDGYRFTMSETVRARIDKDHKAEAYEWLRENDLGDLITETVNASTLASAARAEMEQGRELDDEFFIVDIVPNTSMTKA